MKLKALAVGLAFAMGGGAAEAAIATGAALGQPSNLILSLVDNTTRVSYFKDLGVNYASLVNGGAFSPINLAADPAFGSVFSSGNSLSYNLLANYSLDSADSINQAKTGPASAFFNDPSTPPSAWGLVTSYNTVFGPAVNNLNTDGQVLQSATGTDQGPGFNTGYLGSVGAVLGENNSVSAAPAGNPPVSLFANFYGQGTQASGGTTAIVPGNGAAGGELWYLTNPNLNSAWYGEKLGDVTLSSAGVLTFTPAGTAVVPIPAAVWLMGSSLAGLFGFARRGGRKTT